MPSTPAQLFAYFDELGIEHQTITHAPIFTVEEGKDLHDKIPGLHGKNLFLKDKKGKLWLVVMPALKRADLGAIEKRVGAARCSFGKPDLLRDVLGVTPGSVTPFSLINDTEKRVTLVLDQEVAESEWVNFHPLHNAASTVVRGVDLLKFFKALGYTPQIINCAA